MHHTMLRFCALFCLLLALAACAKQPEVQEDPNARSFDVGNVTVSYRIPAGFSTERNDAMLEYLQLASGALLANGITMQQIMYSQADATLPPRVLLLSNYTPSARVDMPESGFQEKIAPMLTTLLQSDKKLKSVAAKKLQGKGPKSSSYAMLKPGELLENTPSRITVGLVMRFSRQKNPVDMACVLSIINLDRKVLYVHQFIPLASLDEADAALKKFRQPLDDLQLKGVRKPAA